MALPRALALAAALVATPGCTSTFDTDLDASDASPDTSSVGITCANYCRLFQDACSETTHAYADLLDCVSVCQKANWPAGTLADVSGNTLACRIYHANAASESMPETHCGHAGVTGGDVCGGWCVNLCHLAGEVCPTVAPDFEECLELCGPLRDDAPIGSTTGDSVQCRLYHVQAAMSGSIAVRTHCPHAGAVSTPETCGR